MQVYSFSFKRLRNGTQQRLLFVDKHACISLPILRKLEAYCSSPCFDLDRYQDRSSAGCRNARRFQLKTNKKDII